MITEIGPEAGNDTTRNYYYIHENADEFGLSARVRDKLRINADNRDNVYAVNNIERGRTYGLTTAFSPRGDFTIDLGYSYMSTYTQTEICFADSSILFTQPCLVANASSPLGTLSFYESRDNYAYADIMWKPQKRVTAMVGYLGSIVRGSTTFLNPLAPTGTLDFDYLTPYASVTFDICKGVSYRTAWNYYGYQDRGVANPAGLAPLPSQNFNGNNITFVMRYAF